MFSQVFMLLSGINSRNQVFLTLKLIPMEQKITLLDIISSSVWEIGSFYSRNFENPKSTSSNFVPISLLVTLEMVRLFQGIYMTNDPNTICKADNIKTTVQSSNLMEELGQVEYVFSDKTGTLTKNIMEFKNVSINGKIYGKPCDHI